jgi:hypothetical protein
VNWDDGEEEGEHDGTEDYDGPSETPVLSPADKERRSQWEKAGKVLTTNAKQFYGQTNKDSENVIDWVEKVDTLFNIHMNDREDGRLDLVRQVLSGTALKWMNRRVQELNEQLSRREISGPVEWKLLRQPFIDAHLGVNTIETFKAELRTLRLGSTTCPTPVEFNKEFDHLVELAFPDRRLGTMATVLGDEYSQLIYASKPAIYRSVTLNQSPSTLEDWKLSVSRRWAAGKRLDAMEAQSNSRSGGQSGQQRARGGYGRHGDSNQTDKKPVASAAAMDVDDGTGQEGVVYMADNTDSQQLSAAASGSQRGGRGGGGGRGRDGASPPIIQWSAERQQLYNNELCFRCGQAGHKARGCTNAPLKGQAGQ